MLEGPGEGGSCITWGETMLGRVALLLLGSALQVEAIFLLLSRAFLTQIVSKARQAAENTGSHCSRVLCLRRISVAQRQEGCLAAPMRVIISNYDYESSKCKDKCQGNRTREKP